MDWPWAAACSNRKFSACCRPGWPDWIACSHSPQLAYLVAIGVDHRGVVVDRVVDQPVGPRAGALVDVDRGVRRHRREILDVEVRLTAARSDRLAAVDRDHVQAAEHGRRLGGAEETGVERAHVGVGERLELVQRDVLALAEVAVVVQAEGAVGPRDLIVGQPVVLLGIRGRGGAGRGRAGGVSERGRQGRPDLRAVRSARPPNERWLRAGQVVEPDDPRHRPRGRDCRGGCRRLANGAGGQPVALDPGLEGVLDLPGGSREVDQQPIARDAADVETVSRELCAHGGDRRRGRTEPAGERARP